MNSFLQVTDSDDERIAEYRALTDVKLRSLIEPKNGIFIAEGEKVIERALRAGCELRSVLVSEAKAENVTALVKHHVPDTQAPFYTGDMPVLEEITGFHVHRGILAAFERPTPLTADRVLADSRRVVIVEDVNNHTNLGSLFRSAAALGVDAMLLSPTCVDPLYRRCVRVSMGQVFAVPYARLEPWPKGLKQVRDAGYTLLALTPGEGALNLKDIPRRARHRPALLVGAEGPGLTASALSSADYRVKIPMHRDVDSLNVAVTAAIACYELGQ